MFSRLRELRKELAQTEAVPVYALFTNEQLAQMVAGWRAVLELAAINAVDGDDKFIVHLGLLDSIVSGLGGEAFEREPREPDAKRLLSRVEKELATVAFDPFRRNAVESRLRAELTGPARALR